MIKRISKDKARKLINPGKRVIDLGCKKNAWGEATTALDLDDYADYYKKLTPPKQFIQGDACKTSFADQEFDFSIASHLIEHVKSPDEFIRELTRISARGYIEFPNPLFDNLTSGNEKDHAWFVSFDDDENRLVFRPKKQFIKPLFTVRQAVILEDLFPNSMSTGIYWEGSIEYHIVTASEKRVGNPKFWSALHYCARFIRLLKLHKL